MPHSSSNPALIEPYFTPLYYLRLFFIYFFEYLIYGKKRGKAAEFINAVPCRHMGTEDIPSSMIDKLVFRRDDEQIFWSQVLIIQKPAVLYSVFLSSVSFHFLRYQRKMPWMWTGGHEKCADCRQIGRRWTPWNPFQPKLTTWSPSPTQ